MAARIKQIEELEAKARDAGKAVINADAKLREANSQHSGGGFIDEYARQFSSNKKEIAEAASKLNQARADSQAAQDALTEAKEGYAEAVAGLVAADLPTDELAQLKERAEIYGKAIEEGTLTGDALANAQKALASVLEQQDEITKKRTDELAREKGFGDFLKEKPKDMLQVWGSVEKAAEELALVYDKESEEYKTTMERVKKAFDDRAAKIEEENAKAAERQKADALTELDASGFERYLRNTDEELERFNKTVETWRANAETAGFSTSELDTT
ncbi:MAG: hypothetical protein IKT12_07590, partial [Thermoguttaceae bacterium]|nr:hypothetical protein [Thermoguttaceae bacterium]